MARARENRQAARTKPEITIEAGVADLNDSVLKSRIDGLRPSTIRRRPMPSARRSCLRTLAKRPMSKAHNGIEGQAATGVDRKMVEIQYSLRG